MKHVKWIFVVLLICSLTAFVEKDKPTGGLSEGDVAPDFKIESTSNGQPAFKLGNLKGKYVLLSFWASYDAASRENNAALSHLAGGDARVKMVSVSFDHYASVFESVVKQDGLDADACFLETRGTDSELFDQFDLKSGFTNFLIDSNGMIVAKNITPAELVSFLNE